MKTIQVFIRGDFVDAFAYRGRLLAITRDKYLKVLSLDKLADQLEQKLPDSIPLPDLLFAKNNWMSDPAYRLFCRNAEIATAFKKCCDQFNEIVEIKPEVLEIGSYGLQNGYNHVLDMNIYNGRLFIGTDKRMFHCDFLDWTQKETLEMTGVQDRHDGKTIHVSAKYGTVNISCGYDGLHYVLDEFDERQTGSGSGRKRFQQLEYAQNSFRSDWCQYDLVNYENASNPQLCTTSVETHKAFGFERENKLMTKFEQNLGFWHLPKTNSKSLAMLRTDEIDYVFNAGQNFYLHNETGHFFIMRLSYVKKKPTLAGIVKLEEVIDDTIIRTLAVEYGFKLVKAKPVRKVAALIETFSDVRLLSEEGILTLSSEPALTVRTFPNSKQYGNLILIATKEGLLLTAIYDNKFLQDSIEQADLGQKLPRERTNFEDVETPR